MGSAARFVAQWFPLFLLGGLFGKLIAFTFTMSALPGSPSINNANFPWLLRNGLPFDT
jgi:hypothetical protein